MNADKGLKAAVDTYVDTLSDVLDVIVDRLEGFDRSSLRRDVALESFKLSSAFIDADDVHTDEEVDAFLLAYADLIPQLAGVDRQRLRAQGTLRGAKDWLKQPSVLFDILVKTDSREGSNYSYVYYEQAMAVAHTVVSLDPYTTAAELAAIQKFRSLLLGTIRGRGVTASRAASSDPADPRVAADADLGEPRPIEELLDELDELIGLDGVKREVKLVSDLLHVQKLRAERDLPVMDQSRHLVFTGNPGTGKTTVARLLAQIYRTLGVVERGHLVETDRSGLVARYVGHTAVKVREVFDQADEGVLLIDEAYALARGGENDFGMEAIDAIVKLVEDRRKSMVCIAAGYPVEMMEFIDANPGLRSRFPKVIEFPDYDTDELVEIFGLIADKAHYEADDAAEEAIRAWLAAQPRTKGFGNGRLARNLFESAVARQATRIVKMDDPTDDQLVTLTADDIPDPDESLDHREESHE